MYESIWKSIYSFVDNISDFSFFALPVKILHRNFDSLDVSSI